MLRRIEHSATLQSFCCHAATLWPRITFRSPVLAKTCAFLVRRRRNRSADRAIFAQRRPTRDKSRAATAATLSAQRKNYELPNYLRHGRGRGTLCAHHLGMPQASRVVAGELFTPRKERLWNTWFRLLPCSWSPASLASSGD